ncbi:hypothetical protein, partial [Bartonella sp. AC329YNZD]|uniref:hypothetical protein n=1 Tax=Bartonella sp. AC329YNZD TaxID=3243452 RepID=UPI0035CEEDF7
MLWCGEQIYNNLLKYFVTLQKEVNKNSLDLKLYDYNVYVFLCVCFLEKFLKSMLPTHIQSTIKRSFFQFIDKMLERLAGYPYYCFLDGYSRYNQIPITPEDRDRTTFTCPY